MDGIVRLALPFVAVGLVGYFCYVVVRGFVTGRIAIADDDFHVKDRPGPYWIWMALHAGCALFAMGVVANMFFNGMGS